MSEYFPKKYIYVIHRFSHSELIAFLSSWSRALLASLGGLFLPRGMGQRWDVGEGALSRAVVASVSGMLDVWGREMLDSLGLGAFEEHSKGEGLPREGEGTLKVWPQALERNYYFFVNPWIKLGILVCAFSGRKRTG